MTAKEPESTSETARVFGYDRVSSAQQAASGLGLKSQEHEIRRHFVEEWAPKGYVLGGMFTDEAVSAFKKKRFLQRKGAAALDAELRRGDVVLVAKMDRAFRNMYDYIRTIDDWTERGVELRVLNFPLVSADTPLMKAMVKMIGVMGAFFAEMESELKAERIRSVNAVRRRNGRSLGNPRLGYKNAGPTKGRIFVPDVEQRKAMWWIYRAVKAGWGYGEIAAHLTERRVMRKVPNKKAKDGHTMEFYGFSAVRRYYEAMVKLIGTEGLAAVLKSIDVEMEAPPS